MWKVSPHIPKPYTHLPIYFELSIGSSFAVYQIDDSVFFFKYIILILELWSFLTETVIRKLRLQRSLFIYTLNLGRLLRYISCVNFFLCKLFCTVHYGTSVWSSTVPSFVLQGVDLYIKLLSEVSDDSIKCSLQTELLSLLSRLPSLTQDQEQLVSNISCWTALTEILFL